MYAYWEKKKKKKRNNNNTQNRMQETVTFWNMYITKLSNAKFYFFNCYLPVPWPTWGILKGTASPIQC